MILELNLKLHDIFYLFSLLTFLFFLFACVNQQQRNNIGTFKQKKTKNTFDVNYNLDHITEYI